MWTVVLLSTNKSDGWCPDSSFHPVPKVSKRTQSRSPSDVHFSSQTQPLPLGMLSADDSGAYTASRDFGVMCAQRLQKSLQVNGLSVQNFVTGSLSLRGYGHLPQGLDALLKRGMCAEQRRHAATSEQWLYDTQRRGRRGKRGSRYPLVVCTQFLERTHEAVGLAYHSCPGFIRGEFPLTRKSELQQECAERRQKK